MISVGSVHIFHKGIFLFVIFYKQCILNNSKNLSLKISTSKIQTLEYFVFLRTALRKDYSTKFACVIHLSSCDLCVYGLCIYHLAIWYPSSGIISTLPHLQIEQVTQVAI